jgi:hypothetical protein
MAIILRSLRNPGLALGAAAALLMTCPLPGFAAPTCTAASGPRTVPLVELYTSEGCNSCPPADRWLSSSFAPGAAIAGAIPLAFHVDYWDRLGWKDRFAAPAWTERQYAAAHATRSNLVYTPQVLVQGRDFRDWRTAGKSKAAIAAAGARPARANIMLEATPRQGAVAVKATARVPGSADRKNTALFVALADSGFVSEVKAGENAGARLSHDHVVRALHGGIRVDANGDIAGDVVLPLPAEAGTATTVVAFVQNSETGEVLQALALPLAQPACTPGVYAVTLNDRPPTNAKLATIRLGARQP